ncbi:MAG: Acyl-CoA dehydrogenase FadE29 [Pseudonocardiales bacterium]|nr:Acyl-CoA dehydrogenase FadE29 [Pseudonocardiales bacterium]
MDFSVLQLTAEQEQFAKEVQAFLDDIVTDEVHERELETGDGFSATVHLALGERGWLYPTWPVEHGGAGLDAVSARILDLELHRRQVPDITAGTTALVWSAVERYLDSAEVDTMRLDVARGHVRFCLGYTEPDGGSDIAAAKVRAVRDGDEWVLNGSKIFTTGAQSCQYTFLITRTDPTLPKHKGMTMFLVPLDAPGVEIQGIRAFSGERTNIVYYSDARISDKFRLGAVNAGWAVLHGPLDAEHSIGGEESGLDDISVGRSFLRVLERALDAAVDWTAAAVRPDGTKVADDRSALQRIGRVATDLEAGIRTPGPLGRVAGSEALVRGSADLVDLVGIEALVSLGDRAGSELGAVEYGHRFAQGTATYGGTVEVFRNIISQHVLGLPQMNYPGRKVFLAPGRSDAMAAAR